ncbi:pentatricopeptide repeat-containing protein, partial [Tanacetum coccineum]
MMNHTKRAAADALIKLKFKGNCTTRSLLKNPNPTSSLGPHKTLLASLIHSDSCLNDTPESAPQTLGEALGQFDKLTKQQPLPACGIDQFNQILESLTKLKRYPTSLDIFKQLCSLGVTLDNNTINTVIKCCCQLYRTNEAFSVLGWNFKRSCTSIPDVHTFSILLDGLVLEDRILEAHTFFTNLIQHKLCEPDILLYNKIIGGLCSFHIHDVRRPDLCGPSILLLDPPDYAKRDDDIRLGKTMMYSAGDIFGEMVYQQGISPDVDTYNSLLSGLCKVHCWREASLQLKEMLDSKISPNLQTCNILVTALCNERKIGAAKLVLYFMNKSNISPDIVTYNSVIQTYCFLGNITKAMSFFDMMVLTDVVPDISTYTTLLNGCCKYDKMDDAMLLFREMNEKGLIPNYLTCITMLRKLFRAERFGDARKLFDEMRAHGHVLDLSTYHDILMILCFKHRLDLALSLFHLVGDSELNADISVYNELIDGTIRCRKFDIAWDLFNELSVKGVKPDKHTYFELIRAFSTEGILDKAKKLFSKMEESDYKPDSDTFNDLLGGHLLKKRYDDDV